MRNMLKKLINKFGYSINKLNNNEGRGLFKLPRKSMKDALEHIDALGYYPDVVIDVGAADGTPALLHVFTKAKYIWIEPLVEFEESLKALAQQYPGSKYFIAAAGERNEKTTINVHDDLVGSSVLHEMEGVGADGFCREVEVIKLDSIAESFGETGKKALLKIDVQGAELSVLRGATGLLSFVDVVILEVSFFQFHIGSPEFYDIVAYMREIGYVAYDIFGGHNRPLDNALAQRDILFVKENSSFRSTHRWADDEQRRTYRNSYDTDSTKRSNKEKMLDAG